MGDVISTWGFSRVVSITFSKWGRCSRWRRTEQHTKERSWWELSLCFTWGGNSRPKLKNPSSPTPHQPSSPKLSPSYDLKAHRWKDRLLPLQQKQPVGSFLLHILCLHSVEKRIIKAGCALWKNKGRKLLGEAATSISCCHIVLAQSPAHVANPSKPVSIPTQLCLQEPSPVVLSFLFQQSRNKSGPSCRPAK